MKKATQVYLTRKHYKIVTMYRLESWIYISSDPIFIIPKEVTIEELSSKIFESLHVSRELREAEEEKYRLGNKTLLVKMKESGFGILYKTSKSCALYQEPDSLCIEPFVVDTKYRGLIVDEARIVTLSSSTGEIEVTKRIVDILS